MSHYFIASYTIALVIVCFSMDILHTIDAILFFFYLLFSPSVHVIKEGPAGRWLHWSKLHIPRGTG